MDGLSKHYSHFDSVYSTVFWPCGENGLSKEIWDTNFWAQNVRPLTLRHSYRLEGTVYILRYYDLRVCGTECIKSMGWRTLDIYMYIKCCPDSRVCHQENAGFFYISYQFPKHSARHSDLIVLVVVPVVLAFWRCFANMIDLVGKLLHTSPRLMVLQPYSIIQSVRYTLFVSLELS